MARKRQAKALGRLSSAEFLDRYWQRRPLLVRQAFPRLRTPIEPGDLAALAGREDVESRLVWRTRFGRWRLRHGPFVDRDLARLGPRGWTLLVQGVERFSAAVAALQEPFRFLPNWRFDDVMVSYAVPGGGIGAHVDRYDVFLVQALGRRRWRIGNTPVVDERIDAGSEVRVLRDFVPSREWILEPGDMLYLPPRIAHEGLALDACMTLSVGFRAPSVRDAAASFLASVVDGVDAERLLEDSGRRLKRQPGRLDATTLTEFRKLLRGLVDDDERLKAWLGSFLTAPRREPPDLRRGREAGSGLRILERGGFLRRASVSAWAWSPRQGGGATLWVSGAERRLDPELAFAAPLLADGARLDRVNLGRYLRNPRFRSLLLDLVRSGELIPECDITTS